MTDCQPPQAAPTGVLEVAIPAAQARVDPEKGWAAGNPKLLFACTSGSCVLAELWSGSESNAYKFRGPKTDTDQTAVLREIPLRPGKGE